MLDFFIERFLFWIRFLYSCKSFAEYGYFFIKLFRLHLHSSSNHLFLGFLGFHAGFKVHVRFMAWVMKFVNAFPIVLEGSIITILSYILARYVEEVLSFNISLTLKSPGYLNNSRVPGGSAEPP